jgi:hypothetical protein
MGDSMTYWQHLCNRLRWWWQDKNPYDWVRFRTWDRYHVVKCDGLEPRYWEIEDRMLHAMFGLLREFVEVESAHMHQLGDGHLYKRGRSREDGIAHLDWAASLKIDWLDKDDPEYGKPSPQAKAAMEIKALYLWWVDGRPSNPTPGELSGSDAAYEELEKSGYHWWTPCVDRPHLSMFAADTQDPLYKRWSAAAKVANEIEERYHAEDEAMMKRLVAIRRSLWT